MKPKTDTFEVQQGSIGRDFRLSATHIHEGEVHHVFKYLDNQRKLEKKDVEFILATYIKGRKGNIKALASSFNVTVNVIYNIINKKYYV